MRKLQLAYRDNDRTPVIFCIKEVACRHYDLDVEVIQIRGTEEYEAALFDGACDVIIEHLEYLYERAADGARVTMFSAPSKGGGLELVVPPHVRNTDDLRGGAMAVRTSGQPIAVTLWLRMMHLESEVELRPVSDKDVGRWCQWKKVADGDCVASFISPLYLPAALAAGLKVLDVPPIPIVGHFAQACLSDFAVSNDSLMRDYVRASIHAVCLMQHDRTAALEIASGEPMKRMGLTDRAELERQFDAIAHDLKAKPYPSPQAIANTFEIATLGFPRATAVNPMAIWDLHWVKLLDDEGFIDRLLSKFSVQN
jgi:hypothetical protein